MNDRLREADELQGSGRKTSLVRSAVTLIIGVVLLVMLIVVLADLRRGGRSFSQLDWYRMELESNLNSQGFEGMDIEAVFDATPNEFLKRPTHITQQDFEAGLASGEPFVLAHSDWIDRRLLPDGRCVLLLKEGNTLEVEWMNKEESTNNRADLPD